MLLSSLPLEGLRPIISLLDLVSLARLYTTFDRSIQRKLSAPNAFASFHLMTIRGSEAPVLRYVLRQIRSVKQLVLGKDILIAAEDIPALATLNPVELRIDSSVRFGFVTAPQRNHVAQTVGCKAPRHASFFATDTLPNLSLLTPRLQDLMLESFPLSQLTTSRSSLTRFEGLSVPPSLVRFCAMFESETHAIDVIEALPPSLISLSLRVDAGLPPLSTLLHRFPSLQSLEVVGTFPYQLDKCSLPPTLLSLIIDACKSTFDFLGFFASCSAETSSLAVVEVKNFLPTIMQRKKVEITLDSTGDVNHHWLPPSLLQLRLQDTSHFRAMLDHPEYLMLPSQLSSLSLRLQSHADTLDASIACCGRLLELNLSLGFGNTLHLVSKEEKSYLLSAESDEPDGTLERPPTRFIYFQTALLPRSLTRFEAEASHEPTEAAIKELPSSLVFLAIPFNLGCHAQLINTAPLCSLRVTQSVDFWKSESGRWLRESKLFAPHWSSTINLPAWNAAVLAWLSGSSVEATFWFGGVPVITAAHTLLIGPASLNNLLSLRHFERLTRESPLTTLQVEGKGALLEKAVIPSCITSIRSDAAISLEKHMLGGHIKSFTGTLWEKTQAVPFQGQGARMTCLDAPALRLEYKFLKDWDFKGMEKLRFTLVGIEDRELIDFLTNRVDTKTRSNMAVTICCLATGSLLTNWSSYELPADVNAILKETDDALKDLLAKPMPAISGAGSADLDSTQAVDAIGSVVVGLTCMRARPARIA